MVLKNYCSKCGHRILPNEPYCSGCGRKTNYNGGDYDNVLVPPIHNIGFFNFDIDFSPFIESSRKDFKYEICSCGYLIDVENEFCPMCGTKRKQSTFSRIFKRKNKAKFSPDTVLCECGCINSKENTFCEKCGRRLKEYSSDFDNNSNFNLEFNESLFCFCGEENEKYSQFCKECGLPLMNYGNMGKISILCTCSTLNNIKSDFCSECGTDLKKEDRKIVCVCGHKNKSHMRFCEKCERPLNPQRMIKTRYVCSCGEILNWNVEFCPNCGKNVRKAIIINKSIHSSVKSLKNMFR